MKNAWRILALLTVALPLVGCGGINTTPPASQTTTVIVETVKAGTTDLLTVAASVVVGGIRGEVSLTDAWCVLRNVPLGSADLPTAPMTVTAPGYVTVTRVIELSKYSYTSQTVEMQEADPNYTGSVKGYVRSTAAQPVASALVKFIQSDISGGTEILAYTDTLGFFTVGGVPARAVDIQAQALGYIVLTQTADIASDASGGNPDLNLILVGGDTRTTVQGDVISLTSGNRIPGAQVTLDDMPAVSGDSSGHFTISGVLVGEQPITVTADGYDDYAATITIMPSMAPLQILMSPKSPSPPPGPYTIGGTVTILGAADNSGATVTATNLDRGQVLDTFTTGADGKYYLFVPPGMYRVEVTYNTSSVSRTLQLLRGRVLSGIDFALASG